VNEITEKDVNVINESHFHNLNGRLQTNTSGVIRNVYNKCIKITRQCAWSH